MWTCWAAAIASWTSAVFDRKTMSQAEVLGMVIDEEKNRVNMEFFNSLCIDEWTITSGTCSG
jgi:hypothetical protein